MSMLLDLNVDMFHVDDADSTCVQKGLLKLLTFPQEISDSKTSNSSSILSPIEEDSSNNSPPFTLDLLKKETDHESEFSTIERVMEDNKVEVGIVTKTLFPVTADRGGRVSDFKWCGKTQIMNMSFLEPDGVKTLHQKQTQVRKSRRGPRSRSSQFRGVTFYRRTGRWESHIWDCGKQVYLGGFDTALAAARAYDRAAIKFRGVDADINFSLSDYDEDLKQMRGLSKEEFVLKLRRKTNGISRRSSTYRGVFALHKYGQGDSSIDPFLHKTFLHKPPFKRDHEEETSFKTSTYRAEIIPNSNRGGISHNLDLSLGISPSSKQLKSSDPGGGFSFGCRDVIPKERGTPESSLVNLKKKVPLQIFSNLAWQICSNGTIGLGPLQSSAASSGFVSSSSSFITHTSNHHTPK